MANLPTASSADIANATALIRQALAEKYPGVGTDTGSAVDALVVQTAGYVEAAIATSVLEATRAGSLTVLAAGGASDSTVDAVASNYFITRDPGAKASGYIQVLTITSGRVTFPPGVTFTTADGLVYLTTFSQTAYPPNSAGITQTDSNRLMVSRVLTTAERTQANTLYPGNGAVTGYTFTIKVEAQTAAAGGAISRGTIFGLTSRPYGVVSLTAADDFLPGRGQETTAALLARVQTGITNPVFSSQEHCQRLLSKVMPAATGAFLGPASPVVLRGSSNILGITQTGLCDAYIRTQPTVGTKVVTVSATVTNSGTKTLTFTLSREDSAGVYRVPAVSRTSTDGTVTNLVPSSIANNLVTTTYTPALTTSTDLRGSRNVSLTVTFSDPTNTAITTNGQVLSYSVECMYMPEIETAALSLVADTVRAAGTDVLVKAAVPCVLQTELTIRLPLGTTPPAALPIQMAVSSALQALPFGTAQVTAFTVHKAVTAVLPVGEVTAVQFVGTILGSDGTDISIVPSTTVTVPTNTAARVSPANTFFSCSSASVQVTFV